MKKKRLTIEQQKRLDEITTKAVKDLKKLREEAIKNEKEKIN